MVLPLIGGAAFRIVGFGVGRAALGGRGGRAGIQKIFNENPISYEVDVATFNKQFRAWADKQVPSEYVELLGRVSRRALISLHEKTPLGDPSTWQEKPPASYVPGRAKENWQVTVGQPPTAERRIKNTVAAGETKIGEWVVRFRGRANGIASLRRLPPLHVANVASHIERLEHGWSRQAPQGMLALTVQEVQGTL